MRKTAIALVLLALLFVTAAAENTRIPKDPAFRVFPVSGITSIRVENEDALPVIFRTEGDPEPQTAYVVCDDTAHLRLEAAVSDNPAGMSCFDSGLNTFHELPELLDPERGIFLYDAPMPGTEADRHYAYVCLTSSASGEGEILYGVYLIAGEDYIEELAEDLRLQGHTVTWEYGEPVSAEDTAPRAYILHIADQNGEPVPGVMANFCTDTACTMMKSDENGIISFGTAPDVYHIQLLKVPEGYSFDPDFEMYTDRVYGEWVLYIPKN